MNSHEHLWNGPTVSYNDGQSACASCSICGLSYFDFVNRILPSKKGRVKKHIFIYKKKVMVSSSHELYTKRKKKYLGYTFDDGWPKKLNTGRILYEARLS